MTPSELLLAAADRLETRVYNGNSADPEYDEAVAAWLRAEVDACTGRDGIDDSMILPSPVAVARAVLKDTPEASRG